MPIAAYLGNEGWCVGLGLRPGVQHSALETHDFLERVGQRVRALVGAEQAVLSRSDSGFDSAWLLFQRGDEKRSWAAAGRTFEYRVKWNPRQQDRAAWVARAEDEGAFQEPRPGKRVALLDLTVERVWQKERRNFRLIVRVTERTIDRHGQHFWVPEISLEGWWTRLREAPFKLIDRYAQHGTQEQFHSDKFAGSEFGRRQAPAGAALRTSADQLKTDLDLERLPSGKFDGNDLILYLGRLAYNCLRLIGQLGLTGELAKVAPPGQAPPDPDRVAGTDVPCRAVYSQGPATDSRFRPNLPGRFPPRPCCASTSCNSGSPYPTPGWKKPCTTSPPCGPLPGWMWAAT
jgi:hypothetical protein